MIWGTVDFFLTLYKPETPHLAEGPSSGSRMVEDEVLNVPCSCSSCRGAVSFQPRVLFLALPLGLPIVRHLPGKDRGPTLPQSTRPYDSCLLFPYLPHPACWKSRIFLLCVVGCMHCLGLCQCFLRMVTNDADLHRPRGVTSQSRPSPLCSRQNHLLPRLEVAEA